MSERLESLDTLECLGTLDNLPKSLKSLNPLNPLKASWLCRVCQERYPMPGSDLCVFCARCAEGAIA